jgi:hypothetical protein
MSQEIDAFLQAFEVAREAWNGLPRDLQVQMQSVVLGEIAKALERVRDEYDRTLGDDVELTDFGAGAPQWEDYAQPVRADLPAPEDGPAVPVTPERPAPADAPTPPTPPTPPTLPSDAELKQQQAIEVIRQEETATFEIKVAEAQRAAAIQADNLSRTYTDDRRLPEYLDNLDKAVQASIADLEKQRDVAIERRIEVEQPRLEVAPPAPPAAPSLQFDPQTR